MFGIIMPRGAAAGGIRKLTVCVCVCVCVCSGVYSGGLWGLEHPPVLPDNHETNLAISSVLV